MGGDFYSNNTEVELETNTIEEKPKNIILWNVDTQKDFMLPSGKLYVKDAEQILPNLEKLTNLAVRKNLVVISTGDYHNIGDEELSDNPDFINTFPPHCIGHEEGGEFVKETYPKLIHRHYYLIPTTQVGDVEKHHVERAKDIIIYKKYFDVFKNNIYPDQILEILKPDLIIIFGVATDYCVKYAVEGLLKRNYKLCIVSDAIKGTDENISQTLLYMWRNNGVNLLTTQEVELYYGNS